MVTIVIAILAGLVLLSGVLDKVPGIGPSLQRFAGWLVPFEAALGVIAIILGILELLSLEGILLILAGWSWLSPRCRRSPRSGRRWAASEVP